MAVSYQGRLVRWPVAAIVVEIVEISQENRIRETVVQCRRVTHLIVIFVDKRQRGLKHSVRAGGPVPDEQQPLEEGVLAADPTMVAQFPGKNRLR